MLANICNQSQLEVTSTAGILHFYHKRKIALKCLFPVPNNIAFVKLKLMIIVAVNSTPTYLTKLSSKVYLTQWCSGESIRIAVGRPGVHSLSQVIPKDFKKWYSQLPCLALSIKKEIVWRTSRQAFLLCPWARHLTGRLHFYVADRWPTHTSLDYNCEVANPACRKRRLLGTHQWQSALLVVGLPVTQDRFEIDCHLSPSLISIRLTA